MASLSTAMMSHTVDGHSTYQSFTSQLSSMSLSVCLSASPSVCLSVPSRLLHTSLVCRMTTCLEKTRNVREFDNCQGNVWEFGKSQVVVRVKILTGKMCPVHTAEFCLLPYFIFMLLWMTVFLSFVSIHFDTCQHLLYTYCLPVAQYVWTAPSKSTDRLSMSSSVHELMSVQPDSGVADP